MLAFESRWGDPLRATCYLHVIEDAYGPLPDLRLRPADYSQDETFYARYAAHVLWGIASRDFLSTYQVYMPFIATLPVFAPNVVSAQNKAVTTNTGKGELGLWLDVSP